VSGFRLDDVQSFWTLGVLGRSLPLVAHALRSTGFHPERAYLGLASLASELMTIDEGQPLAAYDHDHPEVPFAQLEAYILKVLGERIVVNSHAIPLRQKSAALWEGALSHDPDVTAEVELYLGFTCAMDADTLRTLVQNRVKVTTPDRIEEYAIYNKKG